MCIGHNIEISIEEKNRMPVYWSIMVVALVMGVLSYATSKREIRQEGKLIYKTRVGYVFFYVAYIIFFVGFRGRILDTYWYIDTFDEMPISFSGMFQFALNHPTRAGYFLIVGIFKKFVSKNHYAWLFFLATISCVCIFHVLYKYSVDMPLTMYLFVANSMFIWLFNGARQFLAAAILFAFSDWLIEGKKIRYIVLAFFVMFIHSSAMVVIPVCWFISSKKILDKKMKLFGSMAIIGTFCSNSVFRLLCSLSWFSKYSDTLLNGRGSSIPRLIVAWVPMLITILAYGRVKAIAPPSIRLAVNMSFIGSCFYLVSTFTNGILIGRMPLYFTLYDLYLLPWLIKNGFTKESGKIVWLACVAFYLVFFCYQMYVPWEGLGYASDFLHLNFL